MRAILHLLAPLLLIVPGATALDGTPAGDAGAGEEVAEVTWHRELEPALAAAEAAGKPVLVDLYADWCGWCKRLDAMVFSHPRFARFARDYVLLRVDVEDGGEGTWLKSRLGVRTLPTLAVVGPDLVRMGLVEGYAGVEVITRRIAEEVEDYRATRRQLETRLQTLRSEGSPPDDDSLEGQLAVAEELLELQDGAAAAEIYRRLMDQPDVSPLERAFLGVTRAEALRLGREYDAAGAALAQVRQQLAEAPDDAGIDVRGERERVERALDLANLRLAEELSDCRQIAVLESFLADRPESSYARQVEDRLAHLRHDTADCSGT